jgi:hypothetical protein
MKIINIVYWVLTILVCAFVLFSGILNAIATPDSVKMIATQMGYPQYIIPFLGIAKILGVIAILVPGFPRLKEWAYAGVFFDLAGATYSFLAMGSPIVSVLPMFATIAVLLASYWLYHKRLKAVRGK